MTDFIFGDDVIKGRTVTVADWDGKVHTFKIVDDCLPSGVTAIHAHVDVAGLRIDDHTGASIIDYADWHNTFDADTATFIK